MVSERERKNREKLFQLMKENPDLPVAPMVDSEIVADDGYAYWRGSFGEALIGEYVVGNSGVHFRAGDDLDRVYDTLFDVLNTEDYTNTEAMKAYAELPWIKAIIVYIELPEA